MGRTPRYNMSEVIVVRPEVRNGLLKFPALPHPMEGKVSAPEYNHFIRLISKRLNELYRVQRHKKHKYIACTTPACLLTLGLGTVVAIPILSEKRERNRRECHNNLEAYLDQLSDSLELTKRGLTLHPAWDDSFGDVEQFCLLVEIRL